MNLSAITDFPSLCVEYIFISLFAKPISLIYCKIHCLYLPIFYLVCDLILLKSLQGITHAYLL